MSSQVKQRATLKNWNIIQLFSDDLVLTGNVFDHPQFQNGERITTSLVQKFNPNKNVALTMNTLYTLEDMDEMLPKYLKLNNKTIEEFKK